MNEPVAMVDESGRWGKLSKYHPITLMFHDQPKPVNPHIERYEQHLADVSLPDIPFHAGRCSTATTITRSRPRPTTNVSSSHFHVGEEPAIHVCDVRAPQKRVRWGQEPFRSPTETRSGGC